MSTADREFSPGIEFAPTGGSNGRAREGAAIWLDGDVLACSCPECSAPMSIRLWLLVADCWRCGTSIELTEEQEREAQRLLKQREEAQQGASAPGAGLPPPSTEGLPARPSAKAAPAAKPKPLPQAAPASPPPRRQAAAHGNRVKEHLRNLEERGEVDLFWRAVFRDLYAWLASLVIHFVLLILLAILMVENQKPPESELQLVLSTRAAAERKEGGHQAAEETDPIEFGKPGDNEKEQDALEEKAKEKPEPPQQRGNEPKPPPKLAGPATSAAVNPSLIAGRKSSARSDLVRQEGGTSISEAAVARGLRWIAQHQSEDGSWSLDRFSKAGECRGRCSHAGYHSNVAGTALALLPFLGAGQTHLQGQYRQEVAAGLRWLVAEQKSDGDLPSPFRNTHMYAHGLGSIALCEAYALTEDEWLREPAQRSIDFIVDAQHSGGGWRYQPRERGDTSVVGWQLMALRSAQMAYLNVPTDVLERAMKYLDDAQTDSLGGRYAYMPGNGANLVMTAEALLCRQYAGWQQDHPGLVDGVEHLLEHVPRGGPREKINMYYVYYATQVMHHMGGRSWDDWNFRVRDILIDLQETKGHVAGSWTPRTGHDEAGGRLYQTALAVCTLEVYYRHLPLYRQLAVEK
jgi:hypothetical protein